MSKDYDSVPIYGTIPIDMRRLLWKHPRLAYLKHPSAEHHPGFGDMRRERDEDTRVWAMSHGDAQMTYSAIEGRSGWPLYVARVVFPTIAQAQSAGANPPRLPGGWIIWVGSSEERK